MSIRRVQTTVVAALARLQDELRKAEPALARSSWWQDRHQLACVAGANWQNCPRNSSGHAWAEGQQSDSQDPNEVWQQVQCLHCGFVAARQSVRAQGGKLSEELLRQAYGRLLGYVQGKIPVVQPAHRPETSTGKQQTRRSQMRAR